MAISREVFSLYLSDEEREQLRQIAEAHGLTSNGYLRMLLRREVHKLTIELSPKKVKKQEAAEVY